MTKRTGVELPLWPSGAGLTGNARTPGTVRHLRAQGLADLLLAALALVPRHELDERDAVLGLPEAGDDEVALGLGDLAVDLLELLGVLVDVVAGRAGRTGERANDRALVLVGRELGVQRVEQEHAASRDAEPDRQHQRA